MAGLAFRQVFGPPGSEEDGAADAPNGWVNELNEHSIAHALVRPRGSRGVVSTGR